MTDVLNVGDAQSLSSTVSTFGRVADVPIEDLTAIPTHVALLCVQKIHDVMSTPATKLYVHCSAGQNRSPAVLWLYLLACGMADEEAKYLIVERAPDSVPGHGSLVNAGVTEAVGSAGQANRMTPTDPAVLQPAY